MITFYKEPKKQLKKITASDKVKMVDYHYVGLTSKEIKKIFGKKYTLGQIAAIKAHGTMGTYIN